MNEGKVEEHIENILYYFEKYHYENMMLDDNEAKFIHDYIKKLQEENQQLKEQLEASEKARKESMLVLGEYRHYTVPTKEQNRENEDIVDKAYNNLILKQDIDKGE